MIFVQFLSKKQSFSTFVIFFKFKTNRTFFFSKQNGLKHVEHQMIAISRYIFIVRGHSTTMWTKFYQILTPPLEWTILHDIYPLSRDQLFY